MVGAQLVERGSGLIRERIPASVRIRSKNSQPRPASLVALMVPPTSSLRLARGSAAASASAVTRTPCWHRVAYPRPVRKHQHAAGIEKDSLEGHGRISVRFVSLAFLGCRGSPLPAATRRSLRARLVSGDSLLSEGFCLLPPTFYFYCINALTGSTCAARRAGIRQAVTETSAENRGSTAPSTVGSMAPTP